MNPIEIERMSVVERLQAIEAIWDSLMHEKQEISSPEWHADVLSERKKRIGEGNADFISLNELKSKLRK